MGTVTFDICQSGFHNHNVRGRHVTSGQHTSSGTASSLTDGAAGGGSAVDGVMGDILTIMVDEDARLTFGDDNTPTAVSGIILPANEWQNLEISNPGAIKIIDVA